MEKSQKKGERTLLAVHLAFVWGGLAWSFFALGGGLAPLSGADALVGGAGAGPTGPRAVLWIRAGRLAEEELDPEPGQTPLLLDLVAGGFTAADLRLGDLSAADRGDPSVLSLMVLGADARGRLAAGRIGAIAEVGTNEAVDGGAAPPQNGPGGAARPHRVLVSLIRRFREPPPEGPAERQSMDRIRAAVLGKPPPGNVAEEAKPGPRRGIVAAFQPDPAAERTAGEALKALKDGAALVIALEPVSGPERARSRDQSLGRFAAELRSLGAALLVLSVQSAEAAANGPPRSTLVMVGQGVRSGRILGAERSAQVVAPTVLDVLGVSAGVPALPWRDAEPQMRAGAPEKSVDDPAGDPLDLRIQAAIDEGRAHLLRHAPRIFTQPEPEYPMGKMALPLSALLRSGLASDHSVVNQALGQLAGMQPTEVYSVACYLMALDALAKAKDREGREARIERVVGTRARARAVAPDPAHRRRMEELVQWLLKARNRGQGTWHYRGPGGHDYSNTQFAVLGLEIALEHGISVPREVFGEIASQFAASQLREKEPYEFTVKLDPGKKRFLQKAVVETKTFRMPIGGWGYTERDRRAYASMTAAGASSLLVARRGLGGSLSPSAESALGSSLGWIVHHFDAYLKGGPSVSNNLYYELYSLEKVGDLGGILLLGLHDWYREGASLLVEGQDRDGGWGTDVNTSFALLFLTRATRPALRASPPPRIVTGTGPGAAQAGDQVYIASIDGYISASEFLEYLMAEGDPDLLKIAEDVVRNYPPARQGELVPHLLPLSKGRGGPVEAFARRALGDITGERGRKAEFYDEWRRAFDAIRALEMDVRPDGAKAAELLASAPGRLLRGRLVELAGRQLLVECVPPLIDAMGSTDASDRRRAGEILQRLTGERIAGVDGSPDEAARAAAAYRAFWLEHDERLLAGARIRRIVAELGRATPAPAGASRRGAEGRDSLVEPLVREGRAALPQLIEALEGPEFSAQLLVALERIAGVRLGLRPAPWREWWSAQPR